MPRLKPPQDGVAVRMYRQGHGDCFLLAFPREGGGDPVYVLIDCGYKPGSPAYLGERTIGDVVRHIGNSTGYRLDLVVITHEHQDHVNGFWTPGDPGFGRFAIDEVWLAWTEDPADPLANELRRRHRDVLLGVLDARRQLAERAGDQDPVLLRMNGLLGMEFGGAGEELDGGALAAAGVENSVNKQAMRLVKEKARAGRGVRYLVPGDRTHPLPGAAGVRVYVLGPPRSAELLRDENPRAGEAFSRDHPLRGLTFTGALSDQVQTAPPFSTRHCTPMDRALRNSGSFFARHYGLPGQGEDERPNVEVPANADWRRIDHDWLYAAESLALSLNEGINNTSLVLAFELPRSGKVLLFVGDAQRGNWVSWPGHQWTVDGRTVTARDLLGRTVLYKVGHHGSHNATLHGTEQDEHPNLAWMARGEYAAEFTAMITAVNQWAVNDNNPPWHHPLPSIRRALDDKAQGRVFQTDQARPRKPDHVSDEAWDDFLARALCEELHFDYEIRDR